MLSAGRSSSFSLSALSLPLNPAVLFNDNQMFRIARNVSRETFRAFFIYFSNA